MAEVNENTTQNIEQPEQNTEQPAAPEKKYTDDEVNAISKKNSDKAVAKMPKELGIDSTDEARAAAKEILAKAKAEKAPEKAAEKDNNEKFAAAIARANTAQATLALVGKGVPADKAARFARLLDLSDAVDANGEIDPDKMAEAVDALLAEWPEALPKADNAAGFKIGSDGKETKDNGEDAEMDKWRKAAGLKK